MKNQTIYLLLLLCFTFIISCSSDDESDLTLENSKNVTDCDLSTDPLFIGICLDGATAVLPNDRLTYASKSTSNFSEMIWTIESGSMEILTIENSISNGFNKSIATIKFNSDFSGGSLRVKAINDSGEEAGISIPQIELRRE